MRLCGSQQRKKQRTDRGIDGRMDFPDTRHEPVNKLKLLELPSQSPGLNIKSAGKADLEHVVSGHSRQPRKAAQEEEWMKIPKSRIQRLSWLRYLHTKS